MIKFFSVITAICLIGSLIGINLYSQPVEAQNIPLAIDERSITQPRETVGELLIAICLLPFIAIMMILTPLIGAICAGIAIVVVVCLLCPVIPSVLLFLVVILIGLGLFVSVVVLGGGLLLLLAPFLVISGFIAILFFPIWGPIILLMFAGVGILGSLVVVGLIIMVIPIILVGAFILQIVLGIPVFSILFSLFQMGGDLILIPLSFLRPLVNGISNFVGSFSKIGKTGTSEVIA